MNIFPCTSILSFVGLRCSIPPASICLTIAYTVYCFYTLTCFVYYIQVKFKDSCLNCAIARMKRRRCAVLYCWPSRCLVRKIMIWRKCAHGWCVYIIPTLFNRLTEAIVASVIYLTLFLFFFHSFLYRSH